MLISGKKSNGHAGDGNEAMGQHIADFPAGAPPFISNILFHFYNLLLQKSSPLHNIFSF